MCITRALEVFVREQIKRMRAQAMAKRGMLGGGAAPVSR